MSTEVQDVTFPFTVPEDGYLHINLYGNPGYIYLRSAMYPFNGKYYFGMRVTEGGSIVQFCPIKQGDVISIVNKGGTVLSHFIPFKS